jgi:hypothetical protein
MSVRNGFSLDTDLATKTSNASSGSKAIPIAWTT